MEHVPIINQTYDLYKLVNNIVDHLEKRYRYSLGQSLEESIMRILNESVMAKNAPQALKLPYLLRASGYLEQTNFKLRLVLELDISNETKIFQAQSITAEIGRMIGGWINSVS
jgi:hypothetical protein